VLDFTFGRVISPMKSKSLAKTNPYLAHPINTGKQVVTNVASSTAIETKKTVSQVISRAIKLQSSKPSKLQKK